jgi:ABC-type nitrate/sulfonate/bicarbonate transport system substrate-binding protein
MNFNMVKLHYSLSYKLLLLIMLSSMLITCSSTDDDEMFLKVFVEGRSMSKLPIVIAKDQGFFEKHGVTVEFQMAEPEFDGGKIPRAPLWTRVQRRLGFIDYPEIDMQITGHTPTMYYQTTLATRPKRIALASTDCSIRYYIVVQPGIESLEEIKGKRIGINAMRTTSAFAALRLIERMGWNRDFDVSILEDGRGIENLKNNQVDVVVGGEELFDDASREGFEIFADTRDWGESLAGNSILVDAGWLEVGDNREAARRFLQGVLEGLAVFHQQPELAVDVAMRWYGFPDRAMAQGRYDRADYVNWIVAVSLRIFISA